MAHLSAVASLSRLSLRARGCFDTPIVGFLRLWANSGALGVLRSILRREVLSPLESVVELQAPSVSVYI